MPNTPPEIDAARLSQRLRTETTTEHRSAEQSPSMRALLRSELPLASYIELVAQHYFVYQALEAASESQRTDPIGRHFVFDQLLRVPALEADLRHLLGQSWRTQITPLRSTVEYCDRLGEVAHRDAAAYVAHHYTRYLGDLSGGQVIRRIATKSYDLSEGGAGFYDFDDLGDLDAWKTNYRALLDAQPWTASDHDRVLEETRVSYKLNTDLLYELPG